MALSPAIPANQSLASWQSYLLPAATLVLICLMVVPVPALVLDIGFIINIAISLAVLMTALNVVRPIEFSSFPTVLLFATLLRLALNVASTRVVLVDGHKGADAAGHVIEAFGSFLIGGNYAVGILVFLVLMIINLIVITKGAGRVSEVSARFALDAMPGKQMAIDADLNAGLLTPDEAKLRRQEVATESDFYGSMDGASKFVKGDAIAGVLILVVNIIGGLILGVTSHGLSLGDAASIYIQLAIGDALVAQVPALLLSVAAASIVTRVSSPVDLAGQLTKQFSGSNIWLPVSAILFALALLPGMPHFIILLAAAGTAFLGLKARSAERAEPVVATVDVPPADPALIDWEVVSENVALDLSLGFALVPLVDPAKEEPLMTRVTGVRRQLSRELGFVIPQVRIRDDMALAPNRYRFSVNGVVQAQGEVWPDKLLAIDTGDIIGPVAGIPTKDPTFGADALWIAPSLRAEAVVAGYTVVDAATVVATHFHNALKSAASQLFGLDEAQKLLDLLKDKAPQLSKAITPTPLSLADIAATCRGLLAEGIPVREFTSICEAMLDASREDPNHNDLVEQVRKRIGPIIVQSICGEAPLRVMTLDVGLEALLAQASRAAHGAAHPVEPGFGERLTSAIVKAAQPHLADGTPVALVTAPTSRRILRKLIASALRELPVLAYVEIPDAKEIEIVAVVGDPADAVPALHHAER